jgi:Helix-turn-helix domain
VVVGGVGEGESTGLAGLAGGGVPGGSTHPGAVAGLSGSDIAAALASASGMPTTLAGASGMPTGVAGFPGMPTGLAGYPGMPTALAGVLRGQGRRLAWVAGRLGVHASTVSRWCSGDRPIPERRLLELAGVLGVSVEELA